MRPRIIVASVLLASLGALMLSGNSGARLGSVKTAAPQIIQYVEVKIGDPNHCDQAVDSAILTIVQQNNNWMDRNGQGMRLHYAVDSAGQPSVLVVCLTAGQLSGSDNDIYNAVLQALLAHGGQHGDGKYYFAYLPVPLSTYCGQGAMAGINSLDLTVSDISRCNWTSFYGYNFESLGLVSALLDTISFPGSTDPQDAAYNGGTWPNWWDAHITPEEAANPLLSESGLFQHHISISVLGNGTIAKNPAPDPCSSDCGSGFLYQGGTSVTLTATPGIGWLFGGWQTPGCGKAPTCTIVSDGEKTITAIFQALMVRVTAQASPAASGRIVLVGSKLRQPFAVATGKLASFRDLLKPGWRFDHWSLASCGKKLVCTFKVTRNTTVRGYAKRTKIKKK